MNQTGALVIFGSWCCLGPLLGGAITYAFVRGVRVGRLEVRSPFKLRAKGEEFD